MTAERFPFLCGLCCLLILVRTAGAVITCEAQPVYRGEPASIICHFNTDVIHGKEAFFVDRIDVNKNHSEILSCKTIQNQQECTTKPGYSIDEQSNGDLTLTILSAQEEHTGTYACQLMSSKSTELRPCNFTLIGLQTENKPRQGNSTAKTGDKEADGNTGVVAGVVIATIAVVAIAIIIRVIVIRKRKDQMKDAKEHHQSESGSHHSVSSENDGDQQTLKKTSIAHNVENEATAPLLADMDQTTETDLQLNITIENKSSTAGNEPEDPSMKTRGNEDKQSVQDTKNQNPKTVKKTSTRFPAETSGQTDPLSRLSLKRNLDQARENHSKTDLGKQSHISHLSDSRSKPFVHSTRKPNETHFTGVMSSNRENVTDARRSLELSGTDGSSGSPAYPTSRSPPDGQNQIDQVKQNYNKTDDVQQHYNRHQYDTQTAANNVAGVNSVGAKDLNNAQNTCTKRPTPLHDACRNGDESAVKDLLSGNANVDAVDDADQTPLHVACQNGSTVVVKLLLDARARTDVKDRQGCTPLHVACKTDSASVVGMLLRVGANTKEKDIKGCTPLHVACQNNATSVMNSLLRVGASTEARNDDSYTPLHVACLLGRRPLVEMLLKHRANIEAGDTTGRTPLHVASETENVSVVACLLDAGADVHAEDKLRRTPLLVACQNRRETTASILIRSGAKVEVKSNSGRQPLHAACQSGSASTAKLLLDAGANTESTDTSGYTPLHFACGSGEPSVVNLLLSFCASTGARTRFGHTPLDIARDAGKEAVCQILLDAAANH